MRHRVPADLLLLVTGVLWSFNFTVGALDTAPIQQRGEASMSLREELEVILAEGVKQDPMWAEALESGKNQIDYDGPFNETLEALLQSLVVYSNTLLRMNIHLAEAIDDLRGEAPS